MTGSRMSGFIKRNLVTITMVPSIILLHYGWIKIQGIDALVNEAERKQFPLIDLFNKLTSSAKQVDSNIKSFRHQPD